MNGIDRNLPDAEETEYVVNAEGIKVLLHVAEAASQQTKQLGSVPIIRREAPVLPVGREGIGRCPRLHV